MVALTLETEEPVVYMYTPQYVLALGDVGKQIFNFTLTKAVSSICIEKGNAAFVHWAIVQNSCYTQFAFLVVISGTPHFQSSCGSS